MDCKPYETVNSSETCKKPIDEMAEKGRPYLPTGKIDLMPSYLDVGATIFRTGTQWMSFLTIARIAYEREQTYVDFDARVYDMATGTQVKVTQAMRNSRQTGQTEYMKGTITDVRR